MTQKINRDLTGRINKYIRYRRQVKRSRAGSFTETLSEEAAKRSGRAVATRAAARRSGRAAGRGRVANRRPAPKHITRVQAARLASYAPIIQQASRRYGVPIELICGVILQESGGNRAAVSHCGAKGLMQLMPATARRLGVTNSFDPVQNIMGGTKYLRNLLDRFNGNMALALAGYNAGEKNVEKYGGKIPPFRETRAYVPNVLKYADTIWGILRGAAPVRRIAARPTIIHHTIYSVLRKA